MGLGGKRERPRLLKFRNVRRVHTGLGLDFCPRGALLGWHLGLCMGMTRPVLGVLEKQQTGFDSATGMSPTARARRPCWGARGMRSRQEAASPSLPGPAACFDRPCWQSQARAIWQSRNGICRVSVSAAQSRVQSSETST